MTTPANAFRRPGSPGSLLVFSDDWGRHASSCQHLVGQLLAEYPVLWVNTIGTRAPRFDLATLRRVMEKVRQWTTASAGHQNDGDESLFRRRQAPRPHAPLTVVNPRMWPWFSGPFDRALNRRLLVRQLAPLIRRLPQPVYGLTTLPITADLPGHLPVSRWVYYCVDDFSQWPGLDGPAMRRMDLGMIQAADAVVAVSENLQQMIAAAGRESQLLTHGVDVEFWQSPAAPGSVGMPAPALPPESVVFWGVIDRRMDVQSVAWLARDLATEARSRGTQPARQIILVGPQQDPDPQLLTIPGVKLLPAQPLQHLPAIAAQASVLMMPYADLPVTRAMQPLKLKEYLATGRPVVVNRLPSAEPWRNSLDIAASPAEFSALVRLRMREGLTAAQQHDRRRLQQESWATKAQTLNSILCTAGHADPGASGNRSFTSHSGCASAGKLLS